MINPFSIQSENGSYFSIHFRKQESNLLSKPFHSNPFPQTVQFSIFTDKFATPFRKSNLLHIQIPTSPLRQKISASFDDAYSQIDGNTSTSSSSTTLHGFNVYDFLSNFEFLSLASTGVISLYAAIGYGIRKGAVFEWVGSKIFVWQCVVLVASVVVGAVLRRRRWRRVCVAGFTKGSASYGNHLLRRVEKLEEDLRSSATLIRVYSRQLEKLDVRVRATRKAQKEPVFEAASLAQKNSEATRALAAQEDILEKELGEIQKVLLAMQEQQQKQLDLILEIGKARNLFDTQHVQTQDQNSPQASNSSEDGEEDRNRFEIMDVVKASQQ